MQLSTSEISELIKNRIKDFSTSSEARTQGTVVSVTDGIVRIHGLSNVMSGEMIEFPRQYIWASFKFRKRFSWCSCFR